MLPEDAAATIDGWIKSRASAATNELAPPPADNSAASNPKAAGDQPVATPAPAAPKKTDSTAGANGSAMDKQKLDALINKNVPPPAPFAPAPKQ